MASSGAESTANTDQKDDTRTNKPQRRHSARSNLSTAPARTRTASTRHNKLYRAPPTPPPEVQFEREKSFILDCKAVSHISNDYSPANPKYGSVIPPYNSRYDQHTDNYFKFFGLKSTLKKTGQHEDHESIPGHIQDRFYATGHGFRYISRRNTNGAGHSIDEVRGHDLFLSDPKPVVNYHGLFGYRRNTPSLRRQPTIGTKTIDIKGIVPYGRFSVVCCGQPYAYNCQCKFDQPCRCHNQEQFCRCIHT
ncbi:unnamed protein product [Adineta steineri]|uniref:Uncharacterized protein n=1 Tax=Adineta steineri TaxID=433720 RepID=A0A814D2K5_9BILA|nr:unnamed protein product [Adineta steineri]CAF0856670.1 unnamed protein product [Adineta steineri]CAF0948455.1 unnamed protein product [Adineta steineri]